MATSNPARPGILELSVSLWRLIAAFGGIAVVVTVLGFFGSLWWIFDLFSHFRVQLLAGLVLVSERLCAGADRPFGGGWLCQAARGEPIQPGAMKSTPNHPGSRRIRACADV
jgi:hypothetical protein